VSPLIQPSQAASGPPIPAPDSNFLKERCRIRTTTDWAKEESGQLPNAAWSRRQM